MNYSLNQPVGDSRLAHQTDTRGDYTISTDPARLDVDAIHAYLSRSYWAAMRPREVVEISLRHSLNFGVYYVDSSAATSYETPVGETPVGERQVGFGRVVTDYAIFAYLCDVYILEEHRGHGLGKWLIETVVAAPALKSIKRMMLATRDAHGLYAQFGFTPQVKPEIWMERIRSTAL